MEIDALESFLSLFANSSFVAKEALVSLTIIRSGLFLIEKDLGREPIAPLVRDHW